jgi:hypothetical protein
MLRRMMPTCGMSRTHAVAAAMVFTLLFAAGPSHATWSRPTFQEEATGHPYPTRVEVDGHEHVLVGAGAEKKHFLFLSFNVFSLGLYVKPEDARSKLEPWIGREPKQVVADPAVYRAINDHAIEKSMRMVVARDVTGDDLRDGFRDALVPRLKDRSDADAGLDALAQYMGYFEDRKLPDGTVLFFTCHSGGTLETRIATEQQAPIDSPALCWALVDTFLGDQPMNESLKKDLVRKLPVALRAS